jgi:hypothetical protein
VPIDDLDALHGPQPPDSRAGSNITPAIGWRRGNLDVGGYFISVILKRSFFEIHM